MAKIMIEIECGTVSCLDCPYSFKPNNCGIYGYQNRDIEPLAGDYIRLPECIDAEVKDE